MNASLDVQFPCNEVRRSCASCDITFLHDTVDRAIVD